MIIITIRVIRTTGINIKDNSWSYNDNNAIKRNENKNIDDNSNIIVKRNNPNDKTNDDNSDYSDENDFD